VGTSSSRSEDGFVAPPLPSMRSLFTTPGDAVTLAAWSLSAASYQPGSWRQRWTLGPWCAAEERQGTEAGVEGPTCCQEPLLRNPTSALQRRIDLILHRGGTQARSANILGDEPEDRIQGLWPSDHAGVSATLRPPAAASSP
jgi:hypothetical protein